MSFLARDEDTICAVATPPGKGGISVIRVSGDNSYLAVKQLCAFLPSIPQSHRVFYGILKCNHEPIDEVLVTYFREGQSFTGENTVEISTHGSPAITEQVILALNELGVRIAQPGEFTYRAFMSGRIDLVQAEAVLELIESHSKRASRLAFKQLQGHQSKELLNIEDSLTWVLAHCEANIDFAAEDLEAASERLLIERVMSIQEDIQRLLIGYKFGRGIKDGVFISLVGQPNVGKSSLLNSLVGFDRAIVTDVPGTTRDVVEEEVWHKGFRFHFSDTAGVRESSDQVELLGIQKTLDMLDQSDKVLLVFDLSKPLDADYSIFVNDGLVKSDVVVIFNKSDKSVNSPEVLAQFVECLESRLKKQAESIRYFVVSAINSTGLGEVLDFLVQEYQQISGAEDTVVLTNARHRELLESSFAASDRAMTFLRESQSPEFIAFELQGSLMAIQEILGKQFDDEVMDRVFKEFCLGK